jgi:MFS family permease
VEVDPEETANGWKSFAFVRVFVGSMISTVGTRSLAVAYPLLSLTLHHSPVEAGWVGFTLMVPSLLFYIPAGVLADRVNPRSLMLVAQALRGLALLFLLPALVIGGVWLPQLLVTAFLEGTLWVLYSVAETALFAAIVPQDRLAGALATSESSAHVAVLAGRPLGGVLFGLGQAMPFVLNAVLYFVSIPLLFARHALRSPAPQAGESADGVGARAAGRAGERRGLLLKEISSGVGELIQHSFLRQATAVITFSNLMVNALIMIFLTGSADLSPLEVGVVLAAGGAGGVLGSAASLSRFQPKPSLLLLSQAWVGVVAFLIAAFGQRPALFGFAILLTGYIGGLVNVAIRTVEIEQIDRTKLARVASVSRLAGYGAVCLAAPLGGGLVALYGVEDSVWAVAIAMTVFALVVTAHSLRAQKSDPAYEPAGDQVG